MTKVMTPSNEPVTDGQIDKAVSHYRDMLKKHRDEIGSSDAFQQLLGQSEYLDAQVTVLRKRVAAITGMVARRVKKVDRARTSQKAIAATGRKQYVTASAVDAMPRGEGD